MNRHFPMTCAAVGAIILTAVSMALAGAAGDYAQRRPSSPAAAPRQDAWTVLGMGGGGSMQRPTVSPHDPARVLVSCDMTGAYISNDAGESWRMFNLRGSVRFFAFDPGEPDTIYAKTFGLYRSTDGGITWHLVHPAPDNITGIALTNDHAGERWLLKEGPEEEITALAVDPDDSHKLYAAIARRWGEHEAGFVISRDHGATWQTAADLPDTARLILVDPGSPETDRTIYVVRGSGVSVLQRGSVTHRHGPEGVSRFASITGGFDSGTGQPIIYGTYLPEERVFGAPRPSGIFVTRDGGRSWRNAALEDEAVQEGTLELSTGAVAACFNRAETAYVAASVMQDGRLTASNVARTDDGGRSWRFVEHHSFRRNPAAALAWFYPTYSFGRRVAPRELGVDPADPDTVYGTDLATTLRSSDGGSSWFKCYTRINEDATVTTRGLDVTTCYGYHFDPFDGDRHFITYTDVGLFRSEDGGTSWIISTEGIPYHWRNTTYWVEFDPAVEGLMWGVFARNHDLPRPKMWRTLDPADYLGGVATSRDGGRTWQVTNSGMVKTACTHIIMDPASPPHKRTLYVAGFGTGVWKSTDNAETWQLKNNGIEGDQPFAWRLTLDGRGRLYLIVARRSNDGGYGDWRDGALYRSDDGADSWRRVPLPEGLNGPNGLAIDPEDPDRLYLAAWGRVRQSGAVMGGIWLSEDAGETWRRVLERDAHVYDVTIDPSNPRVLYAAGFSSSAWRSRDRGETWERIGGFNFKWGHRVIVDPVDPEMIFVTTFGGSVWYGPASGDAQSLEDIVTPAAMQRAIAQEP